MYILIIIINDLIVHVATCVDHLEITVKRTEFFPPYCTYMTTDGDEIGVLNYVAFSMGVFLVVCFVLVLFDSCIKNPNFL
jgi:hypothetical protein